MRKTLYIRADGGAAQGLGHVQRCLSIADAWVELGGRVCFLTADKNPAALLESRGYQAVALEKIRGLLDVNLSAKHDAAPEGADLPKSYCILNTLYTDMASELPMLQKIFPEPNLLKSAQATDGAKNSSAKPLLLLDSYHVTKDYLQALAPYVTIAMPDDFGEGFHKVDILINYNSFAEDVTYPAESKTLLGMTFAPLRAEFRNLPYAVTTKVENVLLTVGGSDAYDLSGQILESLLGKEKTAALTYHVICGPFSPHLSHLEEIKNRQKQAGLNNVILHQNVTNMAELMQGCDAAISAGGSTLYELCAVGVPTLCFSFVDNQKKIVEGFAKKGLMAYTGNFLTQQAALFEGLRDTLETFIEDQNSREFYSAAMKAAVDAKGALRLAKALQDHID